MQRIHITYFMKYEKLFVRVIHFLNESRSIRSLCQMQFLLAFPFPSIRLSRSSRLSFLFTTWSILFYISFRCPILNSLAGFSVDPDEHLHNLLCIRFEGSSWQPAISTSIDRSHCAYKDRI